jgi:hypothetical protein
LQEKKGNFDGKELIGILDSFSQALYEHLREEPDQIVSLAKWSTPEKPVDIIKLALDAGKKQVSMGFLVNILPVFFLNIEFEEFENGLWNGVFPPVNRVARWVMLKGAPMWHGEKRWRFASCTPEGKFKRLAV